MAALINPLFLALLLAAAAFSLATGTTPVPVLAGLADWLTGQATPGAIVIGEIRLPRTLLALAVGAALGMSGAALQGLLRNPLAEPGLTGASQGAALGAATVFLLRPVSRGGCSRAGAGRARRRCAWRCC